MGFIELPFNKRHSRLSVDGLGRLGASPARLVELAGFFDLGPKTNERPTSPRALSAAKASEFDDLVPSRPSLASTDTRSRARRVNRTP